MTGIPDAKGRPEPGVQVPKVFAARTAAIWGTRTPGFRQPDAGAHLKPVNFVAGALVAQVGTVRPRT